MLGCCEDERSAGLVVLVSEATFRNAGELFPRFLQAVLVVWYAGTRLGRFPVAGTDRSQPR